MDLFYRLDKMKVLSCSFKQKMISEKHLELYITHHKSSKNQYILANNFPNTIRTNFKVQNYLLSSQTII